jgi:hypothetical protein
MWAMVASIVWSIGDAAAQYINGPAPVTASQVCSELKGYVGMQRAGHSLRSVSCSGSGRVFNIRVVID